MEGGPDQRPVDGNGYQYTYPVPEPSAAPVLALMACAGAALWPVARRVGVRDR